MTAPMESRSGLLAGAVPAGAGTILGRLAGPADDIARTRVLIVDDHRSYADALAFAIDFHDDLVSVGGATSIADAIESARRTSPDVVLLDIHLPDGDGIDAMAPIGRACPGARILILTGHTDVAVLARAATAGASGFLPKESSIGSVINAIRSARAGDMLVEGATLAAILGRVSSTAAATHGADAECVAFTPRESDVLRLMGQGMDPHAIAASLRISLHTCRGYQKAIMAKLQAHSQLEAVVVATRRGLLPRSTVAG
jgi:DNA-binding NarL/FixJ family response regulator